MTAPLARDIIEAIRARRIGFNPWGDIDVRTFGVKGDNETDNSLTIAMAYAALGTRGRLYWPAGTYLYSSPLSFTGQKRPTFIGEGSHQTRIVYNGANTTNDCITIGDGVTGELNWNIQGIGFYSNTVMTGGFGIMANGFARTRLQDVHVGDQDSNSNFYNGIWFAGNDFTVWDGCEARASQDIIRVHGVVGLGLADLYISNAKIASGTVGVRVAGNFGGLVMDLAGVLRCGTNVLIDQSQSATTNREVTLCDGVALDGASTAHGTNFNGIGLDVQGGNCSIFLKGPWIASAGTLVHLDSAYAGRILFEGGYLLNALNSFGGNGYAVHNESATATIYIDGTFFVAADAAGIKSVVNPNVSLNNPYFSSTVANPVDPNIAATARTTYISDNQGIMGTLAVGDKSIYTGDVGTAPKFGINANAAVMQAWGNVAGNPWFSFGHSRGASPGVHGAVLNGDQLGGLSFEGSDGSVFRSGAQLVVIATAAPSGGFQKAKFLFKTDNGAGVVTAKTIDDNGDFYGATGTTTMADGFNFMPSCAGPPTGVPTSRSGQVPMIYDSTNDRLYIYRGGWKKGQVGGVDVIFA